MTKPSGIADEIGVGSYSTAILQTAVDLIPPDILRDMSGFAGIPLYGGEVDFNESARIPAAATSAPFSKLIVATSFDLAAYPRFLEDWDELGRAMQTKMPFQTPQWNKTWWSYFRRRGIFLRDDLHLVCAVRDERIVGIVPLFKTTIGLPGVPIVRYFRLLGADNNLTEWRSLICRQEDRKALQAFWIKEATRFKFGLCVFHFRGFTDEEIAVSRFDDIGYFKVLPNPSENFILTLTDSWDSFKTKLKRNIKESLRHCYNALKHAELKLSVNVTGNAEAMRSKMEQFYHWHALRANNTKTVTHPDYFKNTRHRKFIEALANELCPLGQMKLFELTLNDKPVAYRIGFVHGDTLYLYFSAYDPEFSRFSVMTTLVAEMIKWAINEKI
ncbi:MAG: GNAT family N-acetyltransferase, partial [Burkholderiaceae bacterium]